MIRETEDPLSLTGKRDCVLETGCYRMADNFLGETGGWNLFKWTYINLNSRLLNGSISYSTSFLQLYVLYVSSVSGCF